MESPSGWSEPGQTPEFDEYTVVLDGCLTVETRDGTFEIEGGQAIHLPAGEWVRYSTPARERRALRVGVHAGVHARDRAPRLRPNSAADRRGEMSLCGIGHAANAVDGIDFVTWVTALPRVQARPVCTRGGAHVLPVSLCRLRECAVQAARLPRAGREPRLRTTLPA